MKTNMEKKLYFKDECYAIQGAVYEVYREKGCGFHEAVYQECMEIELGLRNIPFVAQSELSLTYKGRKLKQRYKPDLICNDSVIIELKALTTTTKEHESQVLNYLKATGMRLGLLVNFGSHPKATIQRIVL